jgi:four helix bundle protein
MEWSVSIRRGGRPVAKGDNIEERLVDFAVQTIGLCEQLPKSSAGIHIAGQLLRSATSCAPNYAEARGAESASDFIHKLGLVLKELNESKIWLQIVLKRSICRSDETQIILEECVALSKSIASSRRTAAENAGRISKR